MLCLAQAHHYGLPLSIVVYNNHSSDHRCYTTLAYRYTVGNFYFFFSFCLCGHSDTTTKERDHYIVHNKGSSWDFRTDFFFIK